MTEDWRISRAKHGGSVSHVLLFDEDVAVDREDMVAGAITFLESLPGVTDVEHVEREAVEISARRVSVSRLENAMRRWWHAAKADHHPWMTAVDRTAGMVDGLTADRGFRREGWVLTRELDRELTHVLSLEHGFGESLDEHWLTITAVVILSLPEPQRFTVAQFTAPLEARADLAEAVSDRMLAALDALATVDDLLDRWQERRSIAEGGRRPYTVPEARLHARALAWRGRLDEARNVAQQDYDRSQPRQRPHLLELAVAHGLPPLSTGTNPQLSVAEEAALVAWQADTASLVDRLRDVSGLRLDHSLWSLDELSTWLKDSRERLPATLAEATPALAPSFSGTLAAGPVSSDAWFRATVELVTAYLGEVVMREAPGTEWAVAGNGELGMIRRGGTGLMGRVATLVANSLDAPTERIDLGVLRHLAEDMIRWVGDERYRRWNYRPGIPEQLTAR